GFVSEKKQAPPPPQETFSRENEPDLLGQQEKNFDPRNVNMQMHGVESPPARAAAIENVSGSRPAPVERAVEDAFEAAHLVAQEEFARKRATQEEMIDPGASFIQGISSRVASESTDRTNAMRGNIGQAPHNAEESSENTGQWKMVGADLPPAVASQWQNFVKKTGDDLPRAEAKKQADSGEWKTVDAGSSTATGQNFALPQMPSADSQQQGWVHPSHQMGSGSYPQGETQGYVNQVSQEPAFNQNVANHFDDDETAEFTTESGHSQYLLTENDVDDRAIQTPPPDPSLYRQQQAQAHQQAVQHSSSATSQHPQGALHSMANRAERYIEETEIEEEIEYVEEEIVEEEEFVATVEPTMEIPRAQGEGGSRDLVNALRDVVITIDLKVERLSQKGAEAFANKDFKRAEVIIKLSERLNDFKAEASQLLAILGRDES
ncbi:MAG TPA: hypothetical protein PKD05_24150, partial [Candidatus Melainabacteria bacterium]|nr:hypothetical protein [Candidatus Melainabacteria bacterium]